MPEKKTPSKVKLRPKPRKVGVAAKNPTLGVAMKPDDPVYGNKDPKKRITFPYKERGYYQLRTSRTEKMGSGRLVEDPGSIRRMPYHKERFDMDMHLDSFGKLGMDVEILHDPTAKEGCVDAR